VFLIFVVLLVVGVGVMKADIIMGAWIIVLAIFAGGKASQMGSGDDWLISVIFLVGIVSVPIIIIVNLL